MDDTGGADWSTGDGTPLPSESAEPSSLSHQKGQSASIPDAPGTRISGSSHSPENGSAGPTTGSSSDRWDSTRDDGSTTTGPSPSGGMTTPPSSEPNTTTLPDAPSLSSMSPEKFQQIMQDQLRRSMGLRNEPYENSMRRDDDLNDEHHEHHELHGGGGFRQFLLERERQQRHYHRVARKRLAFSWAKWLLAATASGVLAFHAVSAGDAAYALAFGSIGLLSVYRMGETGALLTVVEQAGNR